MPKRDPYRRLMAIHEAISEGKYPSAQSLAVELEVKPRVIWNDREYMKRVFRAPIALDRRRGGWYYTEPTFTLPRVLVTRPEFFAFLLATEAARHPLAPELQQELLGAVEKIGQALEGCVSVDLEELRRHITFAVPLSSPVALETIMNLREAIDRQRQIHMTYFTASRGEKRRRTVEPHQLYRVDEDYYLLAYDRHQADFRTFAIVRIQDLEVCPQGFARQENFDPKQFTQTGFRAESGPRIYHISIRCAPVQAPYIREKTWHATQKIEDLADGGLILKFEASGLGQISRWVMQYGARAEVLEPPELREMVAEQVREMARVYGGNHE